MKPKFFATPAAFRAWLEHHDKAPELLVGFYKKDSGKPSITWPESVDQALCFGWIDGIRKRVDDVAYSIRFTPRKPGSIWSAVNIKRVDELIKMGLVHPAGLKAFEKRDEKKSAIYSYEQRHTVSLTPEYENQFRANKAAWDFFEAQPPGYKKQLTYRIVTAKREETRLKRLAALIDASAQHRRVE